MDLLAVNVKNIANGSPFLARKSFPSQSNPCNLRDFICRSSLLSSSFGFENFRAFKIRLSWRKVCLLSMVRAKAKKNHDSSSAYGNRDRSNSNGDDDMNDGYKNGDPSSHRVNLDWREFRANLFAREQVSDQAEELVGHNQMASTQELSSHGLKWAHPIAVPETGCVLVATEKLDGVQTFERTVVLLLKSETRQHREDGPFGIIINRPLHHKMRHVKPTNPDLATTFSDCSLHFGGPLDASMFLLTTRRKGKGKGNSQLHGFQEVVSGLCFGAQNCLDEAASLVRFFVGYCRVAARATERGD